MRRLVFLFGAMACKYEPLAGAGEIDATVDDGAAPDVAVACAMPAADWRFDEGSGTSSVDSSGNSNTVAFTNATWGTGHDGTGLALDGSNDFASIPYNATFLADRQLTVTAWIRPTTFRSEVGIVVKGVRSGSVQDWGVYIGGTEVGALFNWPSQQSGVRYTNGFGLVFDTWTHVAYVLDVDAGVVTFYKNGVAFTTFPQTQPLLHDDAVPISVGTDAGTPNDFIGTIDSVTVWTRALSAADISALHAGSCVR